MTTYVPLTAEERDIWQHAFDYAAGPIENKMLQANTAIRSLRRELHIQVPAEAPQTDD